MEPTPLLTRYALRALGRRGSILVARGLLARGERRPEMAGTEPLKIGNLRYAAVELGAVAGAIREPRARAGRRGGRPHDPLSASFATSELR